MKIKLHSIARQNQDAAEMEELFAGKVAVGQGLKGDHSPVAREGEVVVLSKESWVKVCHETESELPWLAHGANLLIKGFEFLPTDLGRSLRIGEVELEIIRETDPCHHLQEQTPEVFEVLQLGWRSGVVCKVLRSGSIQSGDIIDIIG
jgi:MOSC domain-containing protein YiiM